MKKTVAMIGLLMFASASFGSDGQHTGVGGNPALPPPNPTSTALPPWNIQSLLMPGVMIILPGDVGAADTQDQKPESKDANKDKKPRESAPQ